MEILVLCNLFVNLNPGNTVCLFAKRLKVGEIKNYEKCWQCEGHAVTNEKTYERYDGRKFLPRVINHTDPMRLTHVSEGQKK
jgi:hypothetical protein